jgi:hypothetical protein
MPLQPQTEGTAQVFKDIVQGCKKKGVSLSQMCRDLNIPYHQVNKFKKGSKDLDLIMLINKYINDPA